MNSFLLLEAEICRIIDEPERKHFLPTIGWERGEILISDILLNASSRTPLEVLISRLFSELPQSLIQFLKFHQGFIHVLKGFPDLDNVSEKISFNEHLVDRIALPHKDLSLVGFLRLASLGFLRSRWYGSYTGNQSSCEIGGEFIGRELEGFVNSALANFGLRSFESGTRLKESVQGPSVVYLSNQTLDRRSFNIFYTHHIAGKAVKLKTMPKKWIEGVSLEDERTLLTLLNKSNQQNFALLLLLASEIEAPYLDFESVKFSERAQVLSFFDSVLKRRQFYVESPGMPPEDFAENLLVRINFFNRVIFHGLSTGSVENILSFVDIILFEIVCYFNKKSYAGVRKCSERVLERIDWIFSEIEKILSVEQ